MPKTQTTKMEKTLLLFFFWHFVLLAYLFEMGFGPLGTSCSLALKIFSCHGNGGLLPWNNLPLLRTWTALVAVDRVLHVDSVLDLPPPCLLEVNSTLFLFKPAPSLILVTGGKLFFLSAMVVSDISSRKKKRDKEVR
jgi:hypothetical protein